MTYEELREEAAKMGYGLIKKREPLGKLAFCTCGKRPKVHYGDFYNTVPFYVKCPGCNKETSKVMASKGFSRYEAELKVRREWNAMIENEQN